MVRPPTKSTRYNGRRFEGGIVEYTQAPDGSTPRKTSGACMRLCCTHDRLTSQGGQLESNMKLKAMTMSLIETSVG